MEVGSAETSVARDAGPSPEAPSPADGSGSHDVQASPGRDPGSDSDLGEVRVRPTHVEDLRPGPPDVFEDLSDTDWSRLTWADLGRPYPVRNLSRRRRAWEAEHDREMPVLIQWEHFNRSFHELFSTDIPAERSRLWRRLSRQAAGLRFRQLLETLEDAVQLHVWNYVQRVEDAVWDPRGKRALFEGLDVERPEILFLGAADGYEAMQLLATYPGGHATLVDYDAFCRTERFGKFPASYPFLGPDPATGGWKVHRRDDMAIDFVVEDIKDLDYGPRFDIVLSVGLVEHFPDELKPMAFDWHRRFLKPGGYAILTTPRREVRSKTFYLLMGEIMNFGYRELMDARQLGRYAWENGFDILRCGYIKAHNGVIARAR